MTRVASLYLPQLAIERLRRSERPAELREPGARSASPAVLTAIDDEPGACSAPRAGGWRPGARWAHGGQLSSRPNPAQLDALPAHQQPTMRELGRRSEHAPHPFKAMPTDEGASAGGPALRTAAMPLWGRPLVLTSWMR